MSAYSSRLQPALQNLQYFSGGTTEQHVIIAGFLPRHWLYELFSQFHSCGTYSVLSRSPSIISVDMGLTVAQKNQSV